jgi:hypothetical protein
MRSALDHLIIAVATSSHGDFPPPGYERLMFVIAESEEKFTTTRRRIGTLPDEVQGVIHSLQPYQARDGDPFSLLLLHDFDIDDKHRLVQVALVMQAEGGFLVEGLPPGGHASFQANELPLEDNSIMIKITLSKPADYIDVKGDMTFAVTVRNRPNAQGQTLSEAIPRLEAIRREVDYVIESLSRFTIR